MGAWGEGPFDNDTAADWAFGFQEVDEAGGTQLIEAALVGATEVSPEDYLDSDLGCEAIAAAEVVAAMKGLPVERSPYNEEAMNWLDRTQPAPDGALVELATRALARVVASNSELADLWVESGGAGWRSATDARRTSLSS